MKDVFELYRSCEYLTLEDDMDKPSYPTALEHADQDGVFVGRLRRDFSVENGLNMWVVSDNLRKGAATNAVQILEEEDVLLAMTGHRWTTEPSFVWADNGKACEVTFTCLSCGKELEADGAELEPSWWNKETLRYMCPACKCPRYVEQKDLEGTE